MSDLRELYQTVILDHSKTPRNFGKLETANRSARGYNPLCGDRVLLHLEIEGDTIRNASFEGSGCAISTASASLMTDAIKGKQLDEAEALFERFHRLVTGAEEADPLDSDLGKLAVLGGVREFPMRVKCATLVWHALRSALAANDEVAKTE